MLSVCFRSNLQGISNLISCLLYVFYAQSQLANLVWPGSGPHNALTLGQHTAKNDSGPDVAYRRWPTRGPARGQLQAHWWPWSSSWLVVWRQLRVVRDLISQHTNTVVLIIKARAICFNYYSFNSGNQRFFVSVGAHDADVFMSLNALNCYKLWKIKLN